MDIKRLNILGLLDAAAAFGAMANEPYKEVRVTNGPSPKPHHVSVVRTSVTASREVAEWNALVEEKKQAKRRRQQQNKAVRRAQKATRRGGV